MEDEDLNKLPSIVDSVSESEKSKTQSGFSSIGSQPNNSEHTEDMLSGENVEHKGDADFEHTCCLSGADLTKDYVDNHSLMESEGTVSLPASINTGCEHENKEKFSDVGSQPSDILDEDYEKESGKLCQAEDFIQLDGAHCLPETKLDKDLEDGQSTLQVNFELTETVMVSEEQKCSNSGAIAENGCQAPRDGSPNRSNNRSSQVGAKRARVTIDEHQPSVHVVYNSLTRASRQKLEGLLQQWSEWHAQHVSLSKSLNPGGGMESLQATTAEIIEILRGRGEMLKELQRLLERDIRRSAKMEETFKVIKEDLRKEKTEMEARVESKQQFQEVRVEAKSEECNIIEPTVESVACHSKLEETKLGTNDICKTPSLQHDNDSSVIKEIGEKHASLKTVDPDEMLECGEETFFPALQIGMEKASAVSFWMDNQTTREQNKCFTPVDGNSVPLYDRGYALGLTSADGSSNVDGGPEIIDDAPRCFNCGAYDHSLRECQRPRDNAAVNVARKQHKSKKNQNSASRNPTRYYQNSPAGKYDGLRPGALDAETRQLLGLGELDPPPWLNRMREIGYPPGYLDVDDEDQPSGITIYGEEEIREQEDGEIMEADDSKSKRKMTVKFPGINAPIPENADERLWAAGPSSSDTFRNRPQHRSSNYSTDYVSRGHYRERRSSTDFRDDGPPGDPGYGSSTYSFHPRYSRYDDEYNTGSPTLGRSPSDRSWRSPLHDEGYSNPDSFSSFHHSHYSHSERLLSPRDYDSGRPNYWTESLNDRDPGRSRTKDISEGRHRSWR